MTHTQFKRVARSRISKIAVSAVIVTMSWGCQSPLSSHFNTVNLKNIQHLLGEDVHVEDGLSVSVQGIPKDIEPALIERMEELDAITPVGIDGTWPSQITTSISGEPLSTTSITIDQAVLWAIKNNLDLQLARLEPAISKQSYIQAEYHPLMSVAGESSPPY